MKSKILLLVDLQNDFMPGGSLAVDEGDQVVAIANDLMSGYDLVIATQDWHPADHGSFAENHEGKNIGDLIDLNGLDQRLWPTHCVQESEGAKFHKDLNVKNIDKIFTKGTNKLVDSYSGFYDNGGAPTELGGHIIPLEHGKSRWSDFWGTSWVPLNEIVVDVMGLATDYCVKFTALDCQKLGFITRLILPGCRAVNISEGDDKKAVEEMSKAGVQILLNHPSLFH